MDQATVPQWVNETPAEWDHYSLHFDREGEEMQHVDVTREEFIALKVELAKMRGHEPAE